MPPRSAGSSPSMTGNPRDSISARSPLVNQSRNALGGDGLYFVNPGSVDAARKRGHKLAECAILDTDASTLELLRLPYDAAAAEAKAAAFGYRIAPWMERVYRLRQFTRMRWRRASAR